jgi:putative endonuclease
MNWFVYMIRADDDSLYTGVTTDVARRYKEHSGSLRGARYFNGRKPLDVVYTEPGHSRSSACRREVEIKKMSRKQKIDLLKLTETHPSKPKEPNTEN